MKLDIITLFPQMFTALTDYGVTSHCVQQSLLQIAFHNPRDFADDKYRRVDDKPYGGGPGMLMLPQPLARCIDAVRRQNAGPLAYLSAQGDTLRQSDLQGFAARDEMILLCGRYEGIDERIIQSRVDLEISLGDFVLAGGELAAMALVEGVARLLPGALGNAESAARESFVDGLLEYPQFTRPEVFEGRAVPPVLLSGDHEKIRRWRLQQSLRRTRERRPDLIARLQPSQEQGEMLRALGDSHD